MHWTAWSLAANFDPWVLLHFDRRSSYSAVVPACWRGNRGAQKRRWRRARPLFTLLLLAGYLGARADLRSRAVDLLLSNEYHGREPLAAGAFPSSANPFEWRGVVSTDNTMEELDVPLGRRADFNPDRSLTHYKPEESPALEPPKKTAAARQFLKYAEFPLASVSRREDGYRFELARPAISRRATRARPTSSSASIWTAVFT